MKSILVILEADERPILVNFCNFFRSAKSKTVKLANFDILKLPKLISRKIRVAEKML